MFASLLFSAALSSTACLDVLDVVACNGANCHTCGDRILNLETQQGYPRAAAENQVASEYPAECAACANSRGDAVNELPAACTAVLDVQACDGTQCFTCGERIAYLKTFDGGLLTAAAAAWTTALEFPNECQGCDPGFVTPPLSSYSVPNPLRMEGFLRRNVHDSGLPYSYRVHPPTFYDNVPVNHRVKHENLAKNSVLVEECRNSDISRGGVVSAERLNAFTFDSERYLTSHGLNLYDGAVWAIARSILQYEVAVSRYHSDVIFDSRTEGLNNIRADAPCVGDMLSGNCTGSGCGLCYGDSLLTMKKENAMVIRLVSPHYAIPNSEDVRCPDVRSFWTWNDYKPILGENAWALLLGPLASAIKKYGSPAAVPLDSVEMKLALNFIPALDALRLQVPPGTPGYGAFYYSVHNAFVYPGSPSPLAGFTVSIENQASLLGGLRALEYVLSGREGIDELRCKISTYARELQDFILTSWSPDKGYFITTGAYNKDQQSFEWQDHHFAADCQTWVGTVIGTRAIDARLGEGTVRRLWETLKDIGGYGRFSDGKIKGVGYTDINTTFEYVAQPGEAASGTLKIVLPEGNYSEIQDELLAAAEVNNGSLTVAHILFTNETEVYVVFVDPDGGMQEEVDGYVQTLLIVCNTPNNTVGALYAEYTHALSAEWTLGAINWARAIANTSDYPPEIVNSILEDADFMRKSLEQQLVSQVRINPQDPLPEQAFQYANKRYWVPFGWWANPVPSLASTGWAVFTDAGWNPFHLHGWYSEEYPTESPPCITQEPLSPVPSTPSPFSSDVRFIAIGISRVTLETIVRVERAIAARIVEAVPRLPGAPDCIDICLLSLDATSWVAEECYNCTGGRMGSTLETVRVGIRKWEIVYRTEVTAVSPNEIMDALRRRGKDVVHPALGVYEGVYVTAPTPQPPDPTSAPDTPGPVLPSIPGTPRISSTVTPATLAPLEPAHASNPHLVILSLALFFFLVAFL